MKDQKPPLGDLFDPKSEFSVEFHNRPHRSQNGVIVFVTFRTRDSIPREVVRRWEREKKDWLFRQGALPAKDFNHAIQCLTAKHKADFLKHFGRQREAFLDTCHGECLLRDPRLGKIVADSLLHFDEKRYEIGDFIVMPNHVHLLAAFPSAQTMRSQFDSWLHWTAREINRATKRRGHFWQEEPFDHLVRNVEQYEYLRRYIRDNPSNANLRQGEYVYYRRNDGGLEI